ncbi:hypothetical protein ACWDKQ_35700, partial [Saccharopolyspora sp. NPDC000995]
YRFLRGVNQANYRRGDERFRVNCLEAVVAFHNSVKFGRQFVAGPAVGDRDAARLEEALGATARPVAGVAGVEWYVRGGPVGVAVPVMYRRADGSAHLIAAVRAEDGDEQGRVVLLDPQKGEEAHDADVLAATGMWVIPVSGVDGEGEVVLPPSGSRWRGQDEGPGLPTVVTGPKRRGGVSGPVAGKAGAKGTKRTRGKADQDSREEAAESSRGVKRRKVDAAAAAGAVSGSPGDGESQAAQQDPSAERKRKQKERDAERYQARKAAAARVAELEALQEQGRLTEEQEAELAALQPKVAQQKQKKKKSDAKYRRDGKAAAARVAELEALQERGPLSEEQKDELTKLQPKAQRKQKNKERGAKYRRDGKAAAARVAELEALQERGPLSEEQEAELAALQPKMAQQKQKNKERVAKHQRAVKAAAARVAELEALQERGPLSEEQEAELAELRPKAQTWQKQRESVAKYRRAVKAAAARVAELEALQERGPLTEEQEAELAKLRPKAQTWQKKKDSYAKYRREGKAAAARLAELEALQEQGQLTEEQGVELAELQQKVAGRGRKKAREVMETGAGGAPMGTGPEGVSGWTGADQDGRDTWSADADLDAWLARAVAEVDEVPQGAADAAMLLGEDAYEEFVGTELLAFLGQDAGDDAAGADGAGTVAGHDDFAAFLDEYGGDPVGLFEVEGDGLDFGEPFPEDEVWPDTGR